MPRILLFSFFLSVGLWAQATFEVASIKPSAPQAPGQTSTRISSDTSAGTVNLWNVTLRDMLRAAYNVKSFQLTGPADIDSGRYDVAATFKSGSTEAQLGEMVRAMLTERFRVQVHRETKEMPVYTLTVDKGGHKLKPITGAGSTNNSKNGTRFSLSAKTRMSRLAELLTDRLDRPVLDQTGLEGLFEFQLEWVDDERAAANESGPSLFTAIQEQLGLRLTATKGPVEMVVVDRADRVPTEN